ncbi:MFS general substrate transporter [Sistotremastrum niveocremeum HHB9708]|uniref:MFS general substrate transporter n=1 Tax=Sistotremastrum niveocremeum HHB9708 TaxID=1314777 RepID=A0A164R2H3_9AGAM|nr:MFS general substrate transporter [Sistotremastrum niveocremeum HHB9708]
MTTKASEANSFRTQLELQRSPGTDTPLSDRTLPGHIELVIGSPDAKDKEVTLGPSEDPHKFSTVKKWIILGVICTAATCAACDTTVAGFTETGLQASFGVSHQVAILSISMSIFGLGVGPLLLGPLSEFFGRSNIYVISYVILFALSWGVPFSPNIVTHLVMRFLCGFAGSAFMSVAGGSVSDLFEDHEISLPMAVYTLSPFLGPALGPVMSGFINQHLDWRWTYFVLLSWKFVEIIALVLLVPETYEPVLCLRKAARLRKVTGDLGYYAPLETRHESIKEAVFVSCYRPFQILLLEPMALCLDLWSAFILGILYLAFQAFPIIFEDIHGFNIQETGLAFLGIGIGMVITLPTHGFFDRLQAKSTASHEGKLLPETRLIIGFAGAILVPISLAWLAFSTYPQVPWIVPILASVFFGAGFVFVYTAVFTYLVVAHRKFAASALAGNSFTRCTFAAVFPILAKPLFDKLGTVGALGLLAGLSALMAPFPFIFYVIGARLRKASKFATI